MNDKDVAHWITVIIQSLTQRYRCGIEVTGNNKMAAVGSLLEVTVIKEAYYGVYLFCFACFEVSLSPQTV